MNWIDELILQRRTLFSPVILVETDDKKRIEQLLETRKTIITDEEQWYVLDGWDGLLQLKNNSINLIESCREWGEITPPILSKITEILSKTPTVLIVKNILQPSNAFNAALLNWATNPEILRKESTVVLFTESRLLFPQSLWSNMKIISIPRSTLDERKDAIEKAQFVNADEATVTAAATVLAGLNLDQVDAALSECWIKNKGKIDIGSLATIKKNILTQDPVLSIVESEFGFEAVGGYKELKKLLQEQFILPMKYPDYAKQYDIDPPKGLILFGPPGTGKTLLIKTMAKELNRTVLKIQPENIFSKWVGESEKRMRRVFKIADSFKQCILFIDELDRYGKRESSGVGGGAEVRKEIFSMLLEELGREDREWFFAAATNIIENIDPAMIRTGRIDTVVPMPYPDFDARVEILKIHSQLKRKLPLADDIDFDLLAEKTQFWSGSDIEQLVIRTARETMKKAILNGEKKQNVIRKVTMDDFLETLETFKIDIEANRALQERIKEQAQKFTNDTRMLNVFEESYRKFELSFSRINRIKKGGE
ncbi:MAG: hypothetical protein DRH15_05675 [Deltaproteobacteria bacterium]|nr:MAG: hypothetical protein DRH15_05675 [Deltaproteobacteria bacterium]